MDPAHGIGCHAIGGILDHPPGSDRELFEIAFDRKFFFPGQRAIRRGRRLISKTPIMPLETGGWSPGRPLGSARSYAGPNGIARGFVSGAQAAARTGCCIYCPGHICRPKSKGAASSQAQACSRKNRQHWQSQAGRQPRPVPPGSAGGASLGQKIRSAFRANTASNRQGLSPASRRLSGGDPRRASLTDIAQCNAHARTPASPFSGRVC